MNKKTTSGTIEDSNSEFDAAQNIAEINAFSAPHHRALLGLLAVASEHEMDAGRLIAAFADELPGRFRADAFRLSEQVSQGVDPVDAVVQFSNLSPPLNTLLLQVARKKSVQPQIYSAVLDRPADNPFNNFGGDEDQFTRHIRLYGRMLVIAGVMTFIAIKVVPMLLEILEEFGIEPPATLSLLNTVGHFLPVAILAGFLLFLAMLPFCFSAFRSYIRRWNPFTWRREVVSSPEFIKRSLALVTQAELLLPEGIEMIQECTTNSRQKRQLEKAQTRMEKGQNEWESLADEGVISRKEASALAFSSSSETRSWLLRWFAENSRNRKATQSAFFGRTWIGLVNIVIAGVVALTAIAVFSMMVTIMESLK